MGGDGETPHIVRFADAKRVPWKNGGGETAEVAVHPPGAGIDAFGWRVSLATISGDGPFSTFHEVDRSFVVVKGGVVLTVGSGRPTYLDADSEPFLFVGEAPCRCGLSGGTTTAFNAMAAHGSFGCAVARLDLRVWRGRHGRRSARAPGCLGRAHRRGRRRQVGICPGTGPDRLGACR